MPAFKDVQYVVKRKSDNVQVGSGLTNAEGKIPFNLPPGEYTVEITNPVGYVIENSVLTEPGASPINTANNTIQDVTIVEGSNTTLVTNFVTA